MPLTLSNLPSYRCPVSSNLALQLIELSTTYSPVTLLHSQEALRKLPAKRYQTVMQLPLLLLDTGIVTHIYFSYQAHRLN